MTNHQSATEQVHAVPRGVSSRLDPPLPGVRHSAWLGIIFLLSVTVPPLDQVAEQRQVSLSPKDAPSVQAMEVTGKKFKESDSDNFAMLVLESDTKLGDDAHRYYDSIIKQLWSTRRTSRTCRTFGAIRLPRRAPRVLNAKAATSN